MLGASAAPNAAAAAAATAIPLGPDGQPLSSFPPFGGRGCVPAPILLTGGSAAAAVAAAVGAQGQGGNSSSASSSSSSSSQPPPSSASDSHCDAIHKLHDPQCVHYRKPGTQTAAAAAAAQATHKSKKKSKHAKTEGGSPPPAAAPAGASSGAAAGLDDEPCACPRVIERPMRVYANREWERLFGYTQAELRLMVIKDGPKTSLSKSVEQPHSSSSANATSTHVGCSTRTLRSVAYSCVCVCVGLRPCCRMLVAGGLQAGFVRGLDAIMSGSNQSRFYTRIINKWSDNTTERRGESAKLAQPMQPHVSEGIRGTLFLLCLFLTLVVCACAG